MLTAENIEELKKRYGGPMTDAEIEFMRDIRGFVEFAMRNGLAFPLVVGTLAHDINEIARLGCSLEDARRSFFKPRVTGYSDYTPEAVGEPPEEGEA